MYAGGELLQQEVALQFACREIRSQCHEVDTGEAQRAIFSAALVGAHRADGSKAEPALPLNDSSTKGFYRRVVGATTRGGRLPRSAKVISARVNMMQHSSARFKWWKSWIETRNCQNASCEEGRGETDTGAEVVDSEWEHVSESAKHLATQLGLLITRRGHNNKSGTKTN